MSDFEFLIPHNKDDLLTSDSSQYKVENISSLDEIEQGIEVVTESLRENGSEFIFEHFDLLYSMLVHFNDMDWSLTYLTYNSVIFKSLHELQCTVKEIMETNMSTGERMKYLNILKMILYIYTQFTNSIQDRISVESSSALPEKNRGKKGGKSKSKSDDTNFSWEEKQRLSFISLYKVLQFPLNRLWEPPVADEDFVNMCANCCYKALENPAVAYVKNKPLKETIFQIVGTLIKQFNHGINFVTKVVQLLSLYEHLVSPFAQAVVTFVQDLGCRSLVSNILQELMIATENTQDNASVKSFSSFLVEIASLQPEIMLPTTKDLIRYLEKDQYTMRNCVLSVITTVLLSHFSKENMDEDSKEQRDLYLDLLEDHMLDGNAFVRTKVIQLWQKIMQENALPKTRIVPLLELTMRRLHDKSSVVCKGAIQLLRVILECNPLAPKFGLEELTMQLLGEVTRLEEMEKKLCKTKTISREDLWDIVEPELAAFLSVTFLKTTESEENNSNARDSAKENIDNSTENDNAMKGEEETDKDTLSSKLNVISNLIKMGKFDTALKMLQDIVAENPEANELKVDVEKEPEVTYFSTLMKKIFLLHVDTLCIKIPIEPQQEGISEKDVDMQKKVVDYLTDSLEFVKGIDKALEEMNEILHNKPTSEVLEAIEMLTVAYQFGIPKAHQMVPEMLDLVFAKDPGLKEAVVHAYNTLYLTVNTTDRRERAIEIVKKLGSLVKTLDYGQHIALTELMIEWVKKGEIDNECTKVLLENLQKNSPTINEDLILLEMIGREKPKVIGDKLPLLVKKGMRFTFNGNSTNNDTLRTAFFASKAIQNLTGLKMTNGKYARYPSDHKLIQTLLNTTKKSFITANINDINFINVTSQNINLLFELCLDPRRDCEKLLSELRMILKENMLKAPMQVSVSVAETIENNEAEGQKKSYLRNCDISLLIRYIFVVGHIGFKITHYLEDTHLEGLKIKYRDEVKERAKAKQERTIKKKTKDKEEDEDFLRYEQDALAAADDTACEEVRNILELQVLDSNAIIGKCSSAVLNVCRNPIRYKDSLLQCVAAQALGKLMLVSSIFCKEHLQLFITMLEKSSEDSVRVAIALTLGDLLFRFPNIVEPWTKHLYNRLKDESQEVRKTTLLVIYFLVTNEMVKIKGQISVVALCLIDEQNEISDLAHQFFTEIAQKGNTLYNVIPDIISNLSNPDTEQPLSEENFQKIMKFLMSQIQKERQLESLVEKICKRLQTSVSERQWIDLAFCLSLLQWSDRSLRKLLDLANCYADKLTSAPVASFFQQIASSVVKSTRPGVKEIGIEFSTMIEEVLSKGAESLNTTNTNKISNKTPSKSTRKVASKTPATVRRTARSRVVKRNLTKDLEDEDSEEISDCSYDEPVRKTTKKGKKKPKSNDESSESDEAPRRQTSRRVQPPKIIDDSD